jgi:hypothetical protein
MKNRYPTTAELYALEREARRMRAEHFAQIIRAAAKGWQHFWTPTPRVSKGLRHA